MRGRSACSLASAAARSLIGAVLVARAVPVAQLLAGRVAVGARFVAAHGDAVGTACSKYCDQVKGLSEWGHFRFSHRGSTPQPQAPPLAPPLGRRPLAADHLQ